jgi:hypothetical protein
MAVFIVFRLTAMFRMFLNFPVFFVSMGWDHVSERRPSKGPFLSPRCSNGGMISTGETKELGENNVSVSFCSPQIQHALTRVQTWNSVVRVQRLTAWAMAGLIFILVEVVKLDCGVIWVTNLYNDHQSYDHDSRRNCWTMVCTRYSAFFREFILLNIVNIWHRSNWILIQYSPVGCATLWARSSYLLCSVINNPKRRCHYIQPPLKLSLFVFNR